MEQRKYTDYDIKIAEELGGLKTLVISISDKLDDYCKKNTIEHDAMWKKIDKHSSFINYLSGAIAIVMFCVGIAVDWIKRKLYGEK
jgi:hypothetical protein